MQDSDEDVLRDLYRRWFEAIGETGTGSLPSVLSDEWRYTNYDGIVRTKTEYLEWIEDHSSVTTFEGPNDFVVRRYADMAITFGEYKVLDERGQVGLVLRFTGVWQWRADRWQCLLHHNSEVSGG